MKSFCGGSRGAVFSKKAPLAAGGRFVVVLENLLSFLENYRYYLIHPDNLYI
jgi:hypothetical protein